jgi:hypothetical protein
MALPGRLDVDNGMVWTYPLDTEFTIYLCGRHGGAWGDDETCEDCTYEDGRVRPSTWRDGQQEIPSQEEHL